MFILTTRHLFGLTMYPLVLPSAILGYCPRRDLPDMCVHHQVVRLLCVSWAPYQASLKLTCHICLHINIWHACQTLHITQTFEGRRGASTDNMAGTYLVRSWLLTSFSSQASGIWRLNFRFFLSFVLYSQFCVTYGQIVIASESANNSYTITAVLAACNATLES